jgi:hypothetical protein
VINAHIPTRARPKGRTTRENAGLLAERNTMTAKAQQIAKAEMEGNTAKGERRPPVPPTNRIPFEREEKIFAM